MLRQYFIGVAVKNHSCTTIAGRASIRVILGWSCILRKDVSHVSAGLVGRHEVLVTSRADRLMLHETYK
ncbi:hypothetical protein BS78_02G056400 [Paspalum vaginatum]|nr:hypothetical protein BS78_02G056400 [Paspalum vaginatum]